ncbi:MAG: trehalose-phosphatase, partial [Candidatus Sulfotelmatobacter sp.]
MLRPEKQLRIERFLRAVVQARKSLLVLDYDGTLAPLRAERNLAFPYPGVAQLLQEIACSGQTRVVIISGRDTGETISLLGFAPIPEVWGFDGLQRRKPDGSVETVRIEERYLDALSDATRWLGCQHLWHTAEFKTGSIAIDWRGFNEGGVEEVRSRVLAGWKPISEHSGLELLEFDGGLEIRVPGSDKGDAVR